MGAGEQAHSGGVQAVTDTLGCFAGKCARVTAFQNGAQLETGQNLVPVQRRHVPARPYRIMVHKLISGGKPRPRFHAGLARGNFGFIRPAGQNPGQIQQRITQRAQFPIHNRGKHRRIQAVEDIGEVIVAMNDAGLEGRGPVRLQPLHNRRHGRKPFETRPARKLLIAFELRQPS